MCSEGEGKVEVVGLVMGTRYLMRLGEILSSRVVSLSLLRVCSVEHGVSVAKTICRASAAMQF